MGAAILLLALMGVSTAVRAAPTQAQPRPAARRIGTPERPAARPVTRATPGGAQRIAELATWLRRPALPDAALVLRLAEAVVRYAQIDLVYGPRHPTHEEAEARVAFLAAAAARAPAAGPVARGEIARGLRRRALYVELERARLRPTYGERHPRMQAVLGELQAWQALGKALGDEGAGGASPEAGTRGASGPDFATLAAVRAEHRGRLRSLRRLYLDRHPRVMEARAAVRKAELALARLPPPAGREGCSARIAAFNRAIARLQAASGAAQGSASTEIEAALDELYAERAALKGATGCP